MLRALSRAFSGLIAPSFCVHCQRLLLEPAGLCEPCRQAIKPLVSVYLPLTTTQVMPVVCVGAYQAPLQAFIAAKFTGSRVASRLAGQLIADLSPLKEQEFDALVPVPLHWRRYARRGYNQADEIALRLSEVTGKPVCHLLTRTRHTPFQFLLAQRDRKENLDEAIELISSDESLVGKRLVLVDDLMTTGTTLKACGRALLALRPQSVSAVVLCRAI